MDSAKTWLSAMLSRDKNSAEASSSRGASGGLFTVGGRRLETTTLVDQVDGDDEPSPGIELKPLASAHTLLVMEADPTPSSIYPSLQTRQETPSSEPPAATVDSFNFEKPKQKEEERFRQVTHEELSIARLSRRTAVAKENLTFVLFTFVLLTALAVYMDILWASA